MNHSDPTNPYETVAGSIVCTATHPDRPNLSGGARGRKLHLQDMTGEVRKKKRGTRRRWTRCSMLVDRQMTPDDVRRTCYLSNGICAQCFRDVSKAEIRRKVAEWSNGRPSRATLDKCAKTGKD